MKRYSRNLMDRMGGAWIVLVVGMISLVIGMYITHVK
jgi:hypothetical protein